MNQVQPTPLHDNDNNKHVRMHTELQRTSDLVCDLHKEAEALSRLEEQPAGDVLAELLGFGAGVHLEGLQVQDQTVLNRQMTYYI